MYTQLHSHPWHHKNFQSAGPISKDFKLKNIKLKLLRACDTLP